VLKMIALTCDGARRHGKWVGVCGGMASDAMAVPVLIGLGVEELSVSVPAIPAIKALLKRLSLAECRQLAQEVLELGTASRSARAPRRLCRLTAVRSGEDAPCFGGHEGMRDAGRAGGDGDDPCHV
jgi:phosphoenolpyruvate-protein kinase (PTS system EI component)